MTLEMSLSFKGRNIWLTILPVSSVVNICVCYIDKLSLPKLLNLLLFNLICLFLYLYLASYRQSTKEKNSLPYLDIGFSYLLTFQCILFSDMRIEEKHYISL